MNVNGDPGLLTSDEVDAVAAPWVRAFLPMTDGDHRTVTGRPPLRFLLAAAERGRGTVLSLKFPYTRRPVPTPGTEAYARELQSQARWILVVVPPRDRPIA